MRPQAQQPDQLAYYHGAPLGSALFKSNAEDFVVHEQFSPPITGSGEHLYLEVEKRDQNSQWVAQQLAAAAGISPNDVGFCGLKDRRAVTRQWFSLYVPGREIDLPTLESEHYQILHSGRGAAKLRRGDHSGNHFTVVLRDIDACQADLDGRLAELEGGGFANYFGEQRFGRNGNNLLEVERLVAAGKLVGDRGRQRSRARQKSRGGQRQSLHNSHGLLLSAARSWLFNQVLHARLCDSTEPFLATDDGPLWGRGRSLAAEPLAASEAHWLAPWQHWCEALEHGGLVQQRRPLLTFAQQFRWHWLDRGTLQLTFALAAGEYATSLLRELVVLRQSVPSAAEKRADCAIVTNLKNSGQCGDLV